MKITSKDFEGDGQIDVKEFKKENCRVSIRNHVPRKPDRYVVYKHYFEDKHETTLFQGPLNDCVEFTNGLCGTNDEVGE